MCKGSKKVICFVRVSSITQSFEEQKAAVISEIIHDKYSEDEIVVVEGKESAIKLEEEHRETLNEMKQLIKSYPTIESVYIYAIDRLARRVSVVISVCEYLTTKGINLVFLNPRKMATLDEKRKEDAISKMLLLFLAYGAEMEMQVKKARFKTAKEALRKQGKLASGKPMFGYKVDENRKVIPDEEYAAPIVRRIFNEYVNGNHSLFTLHEELVKEGIYKPTNRITAQRRIFTIINNNAYSGINDEKLRKSKTIYPPIVSHELQQQAQKKCKDNKTKAKAKTKYIYYGKGIIKCSECGHTFIQKSSSCSYACEGWSHPTYKINVNAMDFILWNEANSNYILYMMMNNEQQKKVLINDINLNKKKIDNIKEQIEALNRKRKKYLNMWDNEGLTDEEYLSKVKAIEKQKTAYEKDISQLLTDNTQLGIMSEKMNDYAQLTKAELDNLSDVEKQKIIRLVIKNVFVSKDKNNGHYHIEIETIYKFEETKWEYWVTGGRIHLIERRFVNGELASEEDIAEFIKIRYKRKT